MSKIVVGVRFRDSGKVNYYEPGNWDLKAGDSVIVRTVNGEEFGKVVLEPRTVSCEKINEIFPIIRKATEDDIKLHEELLEKGEKAKEIFNDQVQKHELGMKLIDVVYTFDQKKLIFYYTAEGRVDFRDLVKDLAGFFHSRIELRQIGVRDEARKYCGVGVCGRKCCCSAWLSDFVPVSIKMAKEQNLSLNSTKISGVCGRLLCCLKYEQDYYEEVSKKMPNIGDELITPNGKGTVYKLNTLDEAVLMKITNDRDEVEIKRFTLEELKDPSEVSEEEVKKLETKSQVTSRTDSFKINQKKEEKSFISKKRKPRKKPSYKKDPIKTLKKSGQGENKAKADNDNKKKTKKSSKPKLKNKKSKKHLTNPPRRKPKPINKKTRSRRKRRSKQKTTQNKFNKRP